MVLYIYYLSVVFQVLPELALDMDALFTAVMTDLLHMSDLAKALPEVWTSDDALVVDLMNLVGTTSISKTSWTFFKNLSEEKGDIHPRAWNAVSESPVQGVMTVLLALMVRQLRKEGVRVCNVVDTHAVELLPNFKPDTSIFHSYDNCPDEDLCNVTHYGGGNEYKPSNKKKWKDRANLYDWEVRALAQMIECNSSFLRESGHFGTVDIGSDGRNIRCMRIIKSHVTGELQVSVSDRLRLLPDTLDKDGKPSPGFVLLARRLCADPVKTGVRLIPPSLAGHLIAVAAAVQATPDGSVKAVAAEMAARKVLMALDQTAGPVDLAAVAQAAAAEAAAALEAEATAATAAPAPVPAAQSAASMDVVPVKQATDLVDAATVGARAAMPDAAQRHPSSEAIVALRRSKVFNLAGRFKAKFLQPGELEAERAVLRLPWHLPENMLDGQRLAPRLLYEHPAGILVMPLSQRTLWQALYENSRVMGPFASLARVVQVVTTALSVMHQHRWLHCDVTLHNILVDFDDDDELLRVLLNDFGLSVQMDAGCNCHRLATVRGHPGFHATTVAAGHRYDVGDDLESLHWTLLALAAGRAGGFSLPERRDLLDKPLSPKGLNKQVDNDVVAALQEVHEAVRRRYLQAQLRPLTYAAFTGAFSRTRAERQRLQAARDAFVTNLPEYFATSRDPTTVAADAARGWLPSDVLQAWNGLAPDVQQFFLNS
jgi:hypothetical protein